MKLKDGYKKLIGTSYNGDASLVLLSNGGNLGYAISSTVSTLVLRNANGLIESSLTDKAPFKISSAVVNTNLNADLLDGVHKEGLLTAFENINDTDHPQSIKLTVGDTTKYVLTAYSTNANLAGILGNSTNANYPLLFTSAVNTSTTNRAYLNIYTDTANSLYYNPSTNVLRTQNLHTAGYATFCDTVYLYADTGDSPHLIFLRGTLIDGMYDWELFVAGGTLVFRYNPSTSSSASWLDVLTMHPSMLTTPWGITAAKFIGNLNNTLTFAAGAFVAKTYNNSAAVTVNIPTHTSHLTNNSDFITSAAVDSKLANYVTLTTAQTITGLKTFLSNSSTTGISLILKNNGWTGNMSTAMDFYNGSSYKVPNARIETKMVGSGSAGGTLIFYTQTKHASTNPNPNGLTERLRISDSGLTTITGALTVTGDCDFSAGTIKFDTINIPTTSGGTTYGVGTNGLVLKSNGTTVYWASDNNSDTWRPVMVNGTSVATSTTGTGTLNIVLGTGITVSGAVNSLTITNAGVRSVTIGTSTNADKLAVNTNGTTNYLTIPYATRSKQDIDGNDFKTTYLRKVSVANNTTNDFNTFENMTLTGRGDPATGASLSNAPWSGTGPAGGYGVLTYLWSGYGTQMAWGYHSNRIYIRNKYYTNSAATWSSTWDSLALISDIPTVTNYYWANVKISASSSTTTTPTFANTAINGTLTMGGVIVTQSGSSTQGIKFGTSYLNLINNLLLWLSAEAIRFGSSQWDWNLWAGLKYVHSSKTIHLGLADGTIFNANSSQSGGTLNLPGISHIMSSYYKVAIGHITSHTHTTTGGWYRVAKLKRYFNYDIHISGSWSTGMPSVIKVNICQINGTAKITQLSGYVGQINSQIRLGKVATNEWDVLFYNSGYSSGTMALQNFVFFGIGDITTYTTNTISTTSYTSTLDLAFKTLTGVVLTTDNYGSYLGYIGTTAVLKSSAAQALTGITNATLSGNLTVGGNLYLTSSTFGINMLNSDITNVNGLYFADTVDGAGEGIHFYRSSTTWDTLAANGGILYFSANRATATHTLTPVFSALANSGNNISITIGGQNRTLTPAYATKAGNADTLDGYHASSFELVKVGTATPTGTAVGWYRCAQISSSNVGYSQNVIISLQRSYNSPQNEHYIFAISIGYNGQVNISLISGCIGGLRISLVRVVYNNSGACYFDYYMLTSNYNNSYKVQILAGDCISYQNPTLVSSAGGTEVTFATINGMKTNYYMYAAHFYENSDIMLKTNIKPISDSDNMPILKEFDWKKDGTHGYGLIAQELEAMGYSELVDGEEDGSKTVNYSAALSLIVGKLQVKIKELEKEIENLKNKN